jgi:hypothetical protein
VFQFSTKYAIIGLWHIAAKKEIETMGFIKKFLNQFKKDNHQEDINKLKSENPTYNEELIDILKTDHQNLFELYGLLHQAVENDDNFEIIYKHLKDFGLAIKIHLMIEDSQLYGYIQKNNEPNTMLREFIIDVQKEMDLIAKEVVAFVYKYSIKENYMRNKVNFLKDLESIAKILTKRIKMEESRLYILYQK